jgi:hypothetical protein
MKAKPIQIDWHQEMPFYASESFLKAVGDEYGWLGGFNESGELRCILPYTIIRKMIFRMVRFRVETIPLGEKFQVQEDKAFLNSAVDYFRSIGADMIIPASTNTIFRTYPDRDIAAPCGTYIIDLNQPEDTMWSNLNAVYRKKNRNSIKKGVPIRSGIEYLDIAYAIIRDTLKRSSLKFMSYKSFKKFVQDLKENMEIFVADYQGTIHG